MVGLPAQVAIMSSRSRRGRVVGSASTSNRREQTDNEAVNPVPSPVSFAALCKDFVNHGGRPFQGSETIIEVKHGFARVRKSLRA